ncbi:MAG: site-specific DNA-methyltransferase [Chloroflexi bacterium]|nr:site-specific DNA-methyltransferase [Chloroflexota bacterium]MCY3583591.1 site-specific DNA-methyltransferase [Chloroflexota bacterium]MCY3715765.1 site-specific DNA-methyltransferase [Chloroflexota bacterium]MDE2651507.1 site-specific DNA-methyltransferase [Chloroflexota bacterium]
MQLSLEMQHRHFPITRSSAAESLEQFSGGAYLFDGNCLDLLKSIPSESVELVISSPPYNVGKAYEIQTSLSAYLANFESVLSEIKRILAPSGNVCWQVGNYVDKGEVYPLDIYFYPIFKALHLKLRNRIIWQFNHGLHARKRFSGRYETILWFTKSDSYTFNLDSVRVPAKYPGKRHFKGPNKGKPSGNPLGKNPSDFWRVIEKDWESCVWEIPNVKANHPEKTEHPCQFPIELVERCILALTNENDIVLDPYCGVGSTILAAVKHNRHGIGADKEERYIDLTIERLNKLAQGTLKTRPLGKAIHSPSGREKVSQVPEEWKR